MVKIKGQKYKKFHQQARAKAIRNNLKEIVLDDGSKVHDL
jgi:hypothetical protein